MRYIMLIYGGSPERELGERDYAPHWAIQDEATSKGVFVAAEPLPPTTASKTVLPGKSMSTDGPFAETKEQLGGFYILDCESEDEALAWARKIMGACTNAAGIEVRPMPGMPTREEAIGNGVAERSR